ncbi:NusG domain II-containing protein [Halolactibacillus halophilus]|nr:NusG domain II-containing protein [Halolactibacillus halophilus]
MTFKSYASFKHIITLTDALVILMLLIISFTPLAIFHYSYAQSTNDDVVAYISIDGDVVDVFTLSESTPYELKTYYPTDNQYNIIEVDGTRIRVKEDNSPDQIAVKTGWISRPGETSICLPHKLIIDIRGEVSTDEPADINAY